MSRVDNDGEDQVVKRSVSLTKELDANLKAIEEETGENYSSVLRLLLKLGLAAKEDGVSGTELLLVKPPYSTWISAVAAILQIPPEALLRRVVVDGLKKYMDEAKTYRQACQDIEAHLNNDLQQQKDLPDREQPGAGD